MKTSVMCLLLLTSAAQAWAQVPEPKRRHEIRAGGGTMMRVMLDRQASPLTYQARGPAFHLGYTYRRANSRFVAEIQPIFGRDLPKRYGVREFSNGAGSYVIQSVYYDVSLGLSYLRRLPTRQPEQFRLFAGAGLQNRLQISDAVANLYWGMNVAGLYAQARAEYDLTPQQHLTAELSVPGLAAVTRHTHANYPKSTDESNLEAFFIQGTRLVSVDQLQQVQAGLRYDYTLFGRLTVGARSRFQWLRYPAPRPIRSYDWHLMGQLGYQF